MVHAYLDRHEDLDNSDSQKLQDELKHLYSKCVIQNQARLGVFLHALRLLHPAITGASRKLEWWDLVIKDILDNTGHRRDEIEYATDFLLDIMSYDADSERALELSRQSTAVLRRLLAAYMRRSRLKDAQGEQLVLEDGYASQQLEDVLVAFGRRKPKDLMMALDHLIQARDTRLQALGLMAAFVRTQPPHLYLVRETPLVEHLLKCLLIDTSTTVIQIALTILVMLLPHIPSSVRKHLPTLFLIYTRLLFWDKMFQRSPTVTPAEDNPHYDWPDENGISAGQIAVYETTKVLPDTQWTKLETLMANPESSPPNLTYLFTFLYGLYPLNFLEYLRKPRKYLKKISYPRADEVEFDQTLIWKRTEAYRKMHQLHPNFFLKTAEDELTDDHWLISDPAEVVAECMALSLEMTAGLNMPRTQAPSVSSKSMDAPADFVRTEDIPAHSLSGDHEESGLLAERTASPAEERSVSRVAISSPTGPTLSRKNSQRSTKTPLSQPSAFESPALAAADSPPLPPHGPTWGSKELPSARNSSLASGLAHVDNKPASKSPVPSTPALKNTSLLQREAMFLRNDLDFERYLKQQHLSHIGQLQRRLIKEATIEADIQTLIQTNKTLKAKLTKANDSYASLKKETATGRSNSKKFETELSSRVRSLREDERRWRIHEEDLKVELDKAQTDCTHLRRLIVESEARELLGQQKLASMELEREQLGALKARNAELEERLRIYDARQIQYEAAITEAEVLRNELAIAQLQVQGKDGNAERARHAMQDRIDELEVQVYDLQHGQGGTLNPAMKQMLGETIAEANRRLGLIKKDYSDLKQKYRELEARSKGLSDEDHEATSRSLSSPIPVRPMRPDETLADSASIKSAGSSNNARLSFHGTPGNRRSAVSASGRESVVPSPSPKSPPRKALAGGISSLLARSGTPDTVHSAPSEADSFYSNPRSHFSDETLDDEAKKNAKGKKKRKDFNSFFT